MSSYTIYVVPQAWKEMKHLQGNMRQRTKREIDKLRDEPRPSNSKRLDVEQLSELSFELRRLRLDRWRIVYAITEAEKTVDVLAVRKRPPYDYGDLQRLIQEVL